MGLTRAAVVLLAVLVAGLAGCSGDAGLSAGDVTGEWVEPGSDPPVSLELAEGGAVSGTDGCNQLVGDWEIDGESIDFGDLGSTAMACDGVDTWLSGADSATLAGDELTILDDDGAELGTLTRSS